MTWTDLGQIAAANAQSTSTGKIVSELCPYGGKVYAGYGDYDANTGPIDVVSVDGVTGSYATAYASFDTEATWAMRVVDGKLWLPAIDPTSGTDPEALVFDGTSWVRCWGATVATDHQYDIVKFGSDIYLAGAKYISPSDSDAIVSKLTSAPGGSFGGVTTWSNTYINTGKFRCLALFVLGSTLYAVVEFGVSYSTTDGSSWSATGIDVLPSGQDCVKPLVMSGKAYYRGDFTARAVTYNLFAFDGSTVTTVRSGDAYDHCLVDDVLHVLVSDGTIRSTPDGTNWTTVRADVPSGARSLAHLDGRFYVGTTDSHVWRTGSEVIVEQPVVTAGGDQITNAGGDRVTLPDLDLVDSSGNRVVVP